MTPQLVAETVSELTRAGIAENVATNAPSVLQNGNSNGLNGHPTPKPSPFELDASKLTYRYTSSPRPVPAADSAEVWSSGHATDHMVKVPWSASSGWGTPSLEPYGPLSISPIAPALQYATECFEGMKVYRGHDGVARLFRPDRNARRMLASAARVALPAFAPGELVKLIAALAAVDAPRWLPAARPGEYLYIRPTLIGTSATVAVKRPDEALLYVVMVLFPRYDDPEGSLGPPGTAGPRAKKGIRLFASDEDTVRAWPGGFGASKVGANYGPSLVASAAAAARGYDQVLWLFGKEGTITEAGACNFMSVIKDKATGRLQLITAPLEDQIILPGVTRISVLEAARTMLKGELEVVERNMTIHEFIEAADEGRLVEAFAVGTAFFIASIGEVHYRGRDVDVPMVEGVMGHYTKVLREELGGIQYGRVRHPWQYDIKETGYKAASA